MVALRVGDTINVTYEGVITRLDTQGYAKRFKDKSGNLHEINKTDNTIVLFKRHDFVPGTMYYYGLKDEYWLYSTSCFWYLVSKSDGAMHPYPESALRQVLPELVELVPDEDENK